LTKLHNEDVMEGWLPLTPKANMMADLGGGLSSSRRGSSGASSLLGHRVTGALRVRLQWVHSLPALVAYRLQLSRGVAQSTEQLLAARRRALHGLRDSCWAGVARPGRLRLGRSRGQPPAGEQHSLGASGVDRFRRRRSQRRRRRQRQRHEPSRGRAAPFGALRQRQQRPRRRGRRRRRAAGWGRGQRARRGAGQGRSRHGLRARRR
jgi:hypothetical protein